jgi:hypothetical protein
MHASSEEEIMNSVVAWLKDNYVWLVPVVVAVMSSLATGLSEYPKASGVVKVLKLILGVISAVQFKDSPGSLKLPGFPAKTPAPRMAFMRRRPLRPQPHVWRS